MKGTPSEKRCPSGGQNQNLSVVFLCSNEKSPQFSLRRFPFWWTQSGLNRRPYGCEKAYKPFCMISNCFWCFLLGFSFFPSLFRTLISMCCAAVCGVFCGQKRSQPFAGNGFPAWTGSIFRAFVCLHCNSEGVIKPVISVPSMPQKLGGCKQKETFCFWRLRKLKRIFMRFHHSP